MQECLGIAITALILSQVLKQIKSTLAIYPVIAAGIVILIKIMPVVGECIAQLIEFTVSITSEKESVVMLISCGGIGIMGSLGAILCEAWGEKQLSQILEFAATAFLMAIGIPMLIKIAQEMFEILNMI